MTHYTVLNYKTCLLLANKDSYIWNQLRISGGVGHLLLLCNLLILMYYLIYLNNNNLNAVKIMIILNDYYLIPKRWLIISCIKKLSWRKKDEQNKPNWMYVYWTYMYTKWAERHISNTVGILPHYFEILVALIHFPCF